MKRLLILAVAATLTVSAVGCFHCFRRGQSCNTCAPAPQPVSSCGDSYYGSPMGAPMGAPQIVPGPIQ
jgi:hypothetical protein